MDFRWRNFRFRQMYRSQMDPYRGTGPLLSLPTPFFHIQVFPPGSVPEPIFCENRFQKVPGPKSALVFSSLLFSLPFSLPGFPALPVDHLSAGESLCDHIIGGIVHSPLILEPDFHFGRWTFTSISSPEIVYWRQTKGYLCCII